jgi:hypothetical protein
MIFEKKRESASEVGNAGLSCSGFIPGVSGWQRRFNVPTTAPIMNTPAQ